jgi:hypothetical protein
MHAVCVVLTSFAVMQCTQHTHTKTSHIHAYTHTPREGQIADGYRANDCELCVCELMKPAFSFHSFQISVAGGKGTLGARGRFPNNNFFLCKVSDKTLECCTYLEGTTSLSINAWFRSCIFQVHRLLVQWTHREPILLLLHSQTQDKVSFFFFLRFIMNRESVLIFYFFISF